MIKEIICVGHLGWLFGVDRLILCRLYSTTTADWHVYQLLVSMCLDPY
jgi:hypothetical protein